MEPSYAEQLAAILIRLFSDPPLPSLQRIVSAIFLNLWTETSTEPSPREKLVVVHYDERRVH